MNLPSRLVAVPLLVGLLLGAQACGEATEPEPLGPRPVYTHLIKTPQETVERSFSGMVRSLEGVELGFEVGGRIIELTAEEGRSYPPNTPLARLDDTGYRADFNNAQAHFAAAEADLQRTLRLYENANASKSQLDSAMASRETAKANLDIAEKRMADTILRMPYDGVVGRVIADKQGVISPGAPVVSIRGENGLNIEIGIPATVVDQVKVGMEADVKLGSLPHLKQKAIVDQISPQISENTTYLVTLNLQDPSREVLEGMDGEATLVLPNPAGSTIAVPLVCVASGGDRSSYVWVVKPFATDGESNSNREAVITRRKVTTGQLRGNNQVEILEGLVSGEFIVSRGVHQVEEGQTVLIDPKHQD